MKVKKIEIYFPVEVDLLLGHQVLLDRFLRQICQQCCPKEKIMWPSTQGFNIFDYPLTKEEEEDWKPKPTDWSTYQIGCSIKDKR